jgi:long-chain-fatty-acid--CoA ligase ACSBG
MDSEGFFHTGDIGCIDPKTGHLEITGRQKEIIITAGGENVSPIPIEVAIKEACPIISHVIVIGDERKYLTCLITIKCRSDHQSQGGKPSKELAPEVISFIQGLGKRGKTTLDEVKQDPEILTFI